MKLALAVSLFVALLAAPVHAGVARQCPQRAAGPAGVKALIRCAAPKLGVSTREALHIAYRESNFEPWVCNASDHCGVYQVYPPLWRHMLSRYVYGSLLNPLNRTHGRANVILSLRLMRHEGFWPWRATA